MEKMVKVTLSEKEEEVLSIVLKSLHDLIDKECKGSEYVIRGFFTAELKCMVDSAEKVLWNANTEDEVSETDVVFTCACLYGEEPNVPACRTLRNRLEKEVFGRTIVEKGEEEDD